MAFGDRHLHRASVRGPMTGAYHTFTLTPFAATATPGAVTSTYRLLLPFACRVMEIGAATNSSSGGASRPTMQVTDGTNNLMAGTAFTFVSAGAAVATPTSAMGTLVAAQRTRAKGDILQVQITTVVTEAVAGCTVTITVYILDHVVADEAND